MDPLVLSLDLLVVPHHDIEECQPHCASEIREELLRPKLQFGQPASSHAPVESF